MAVKNKTRAEIDAEILANFIKVSNAAKKKIKEKRDEDNLYYENADRDFSAQNEKWEKWWRENEAKVLANSNPDWDEKAVAETLKNKELMLQENKARIAARSPYDANETFDVMNTLAENRKSNNESGILSSMNMQDMYGEAKLQKLAEVKSNLATRSPYDANETFDVMNTELAENRKSNNESGILSSMNMQDMYGALRQENQNKLNEEQLRPRLRPVVKELPSSLLDTTSETLRDGSAGEGGSISNTVNETVVNDPPPPASTPVEKPGMYESLSKTQKRMMAFAGLRDAGAALQGREGNALNNLMSDFTDRADQRRKAEAASNLQASNAAFLQNFSSNFATPSSEDSSVSVGEDGQVVMDYSKMPSVESLLASFDKQQNAITTALASGNSNFDGPTAKVLYDQVKDKRQRLIDDSTAIYTTSTFVDAMDNILNMSDEELKPVTGLAGGYKQWFAKTGLLGERSNTIVNQIEQIKGKTFLEAFKTLKGGGQITEVEGKKATEAMIAFNDATTGPELKLAVLKLRESVVDLAKGGRNSAYRGQFERADVKKPTMVLGEDGIYRFQ